MKFDEFQHSTQPAASATNGGRFSGSWMESHSPQTPDNSGASMLNVAWPNLPLDELPVRRIRRLSAARSANNAVSPVSIRQTPRAGTGLFQLEWGD